MSFSPMHSPSKWLRSLSRSESRQRSNST